MIGDTNYQSSSTESCLSKKTARKNNTELNNSNSNISPSKLSTNSNFSSKSFSESDISNDNISFNFNQKFFKNNPNLKYKTSIKYSNNDFGINDTFEVFFSFKDKTNYLALSTNKTYKIKLINLNKDKLYILLKGHQHNITSIRYFFNQKNYHKEYLVSSDEDKNIFIWDIFNNFNIKFIISTQYFLQVYSCLIFFDINISQNIKNKSNRENQLSDYLITSTDGISNVNQNESSRIYSLNNGKFIKNIFNTNLNHTYYILPWIKNESEYFLVELCYYKISIHYLLKDEIYCEFSSKGNGNEEYFSGFIYSKKENDLVFDFLINSGLSGNIYIWDLDKKSLVKNFQVGCRINMILNWNEKFIIVGDYDKKNIRIVDIDKMRCISVINVKINENKNLNLNENNLDKKKKNTGLSCLKKVIYSDLCESILIGSKNGEIKIYSTEEKKEKGNK